MDTSPADHPGPPHPQDAPEAAPGFIVLKTGDSVLPLLARLVLGGVVLVEGARKFTDPMGFGIGRFEALGFPFPGFFAPLVGGFEVACALLLLVGLGVRVAAFPPLTIVLFALLIVRRADPVGALYEVTLAALAVFLLFRGGGRFSLDRTLWVNAQEGDAGNAGNAEG
jgi:putative oxidoreductase